VGNAATERMRKLKLLDEFKAVAELDAKLPRSQFYRPAKVDRPEVPGWPLAGGPKYRHFYIERTDGSDHLATVPNEPYCNTDTSASGRPRNEYTVSGYHEVWAEELAAIIVKQQSACRARLDAAVAAEEAVNAVPIAAVEVVNGRRRNVKRNA
jgi:hypothetical protein